MAIIESSFPSPPITYYLFGQEIAMDWGQGMSIASSIWFALAFVAVVLLMLLWLELRALYRCYKAKVQQQANEPTPLTPLILVAHGNTGSNVAGRVQYDLVNLARHAVYVTTVSIKSGAAGQEVHEIYAVLEASQTMTLFKQSLSTNNLLLVNSQEAANQLLTFCYFQGTDLYDSDSGDEKGYMRSYDCHALSSGQVRTFPLSSMNDWIALEEQETVNNKR